MNTEPTTANDSLDALKARFLALPPKLRVLLGVAVVAVGAAALIWNGADAVGVDAYLFTGLEAADAGDIVGKLKEQRVPYSLEAGGTAIMVPQAKVHELRLALAQAGLPRGGGVGFEIFDKPTYGQSDFVQQKNYVRALQGELERTIASISSVQKARVHLVLPEKRLFREANDGAQASVVVKVRQGRVISEPQAAGIVHLVASSVPGLAPERVTLLDDMGHLLSTPTNGQGLSSQDLDYKRKLEQSLENKVRSILDSAVGARQSSVQVSAELDFTKVERVEESYDPEKKVVRSEQTSDDRQTTRNQGAGGVPAVQANLPGVTNTAQASSQPVGNESERRSETRNYEVSKVTSRTVLAPARVQRINAAVLIDGKLPQAEVDALASIVKQAIGMDDKRGDELAIRSVTFHASEDEKVEDPPAVLGFVRDNAKTVALLLVGCAAALALLIVALSGRKAKYHPAPVAMLGAGPRSVKEMEAMMAGQQALPQGATQASVSGDQLQLKSAVLNDNQKAVGVLRGWLSEAK